MYRPLLRVAHTVACAALLAIGLPARAATIVAGSGASPPSSATGIYEIAVATTDGKQVQQALALIHEGALKEVHSRSARGYQRREAGSTAIRVSTTAYNQLLTLAGGVNRDANGLPLATRCQFYTVAGIPTTGMGCPTTVTTRPATVPPANGTCPAGYELKLATVNGMKQLTCVLMTHAPPLRALRERFAWIDAPTPSPPRSMADWIEDLIPISTAEARLLQFHFKSALFLNSISFEYFNPEAGGTDYGAWRFEGFGLLIIWANDGP